MSKFGYLIVLLISVADKLMSMEEIRVSKFSTKNCHAEPTEEEGGPTSHKSLKLRSRLECASTCANKNCNSYSYSRQTAECRMRFSGVYNTTGQWYCVPSLSTALLRTGSCATPYQSFFSTCITHIRRVDEPFHSYAGMQHICSMVGGQLYKIEIVHPSKEAWVKAYSLEHGLGMYVVQGQVRGLLFKEWCNDDYSVAASIFLPLGDYLTVNYGFLQNAGSSLFSVQGVICEQI